MISTVIIALVSFAAGICVQRTLTAYRVGQRQAARDEYRFATAPVVQHSTEDAIRQAGC